MTPLILLTLLALVPAAFTWWNGRTMRPFLDDPALPERLQAARGRGTLIVAASLALMIAFGPMQLVWTVPLLIVARMIAGYRIRKALYRDQWSLREYLSFFSRLVVASYGFWVMLSLLPAAAAVAGSRDWMIGAALAAVLGAWSTHYSRVFAAIMRGRAIDDSVIRPRFAHMVEQCGLANVRLEQVDMRGGVFANAVALPSIKHPTVLVSSTLIDRLDADETTAILGHELAHIEQYNPRVLRGMARVTWTLIAAGALLAPLVRLAFPDERGTLSTIWPAAVIVTLAIRARHRQKYETESDLRALALTGNPDALIRALTKLHVFARIPRRWDTDFEQHATHPSLARRIQAIRHAAGDAPSTEAAPGTRQVDPSGAAAVETRRGGETLAEAARFVDADGKRAMTFHADRLELNEGVAGSHSIGYGLLTMLRVEVKASAAPRLVAVDASRHRWSVSLRQEDLARVQATLDIVDGRLGAARAPALSPALPRLVAIIAIAVAMLGGQIAAGLVAWLATIQPASPLVGAAGAAAIAAAGVMWRDRLASMQPDALIAVALFLSGVVLLVVRAKNRDDNATVRVRMLTVALAIAAAVACAFMLASGTAVDRRAGASSRGARMAISRGADDRACRRAGVLAIGKSALHRGGTCGTRMCGDVHRIVGIPHPLR